MSTLTPAPLQRPRGHTLRKLQKGQHLPFGAVKNLEEVLKIAARAKVVLDGTEVAPRQIDPSGQRARLGKAQRTLQWVRAKLRPAYRTQDRHNVWWAPLQIHGSPPARTVRDPFLSPAILQLFPCLAPVWVSSAEECSGERMQRTEE